jgi:hypothetical protein
MAFVASVAIASTSNRSIVIVMPDIVAIERGAFPQSGVFYVTVGVAVRLYDLLLGSIRWCLSHTKKRNIKYKNKKLRGVAGLTPKSC